MSTPAAGAREFYISTNKGLLPSQADWTPDGAMKFAAAYAAERVRQAREKDTHIIRAYAEEVNMFIKQNKKLEAELAQLRQG